jgi:hypothetical protein
MGETQIDMVRSARLQSIPVERVQSLGTYVVPRQLEPSSGGLSTA